MEWIQGPIICRGSTATVSLAATATGHHFAIKSSPLPTSHFLQKEQHILSQLSSKHIIKYIGFNITSNMFNLFIEYAPFGTISDVIKKQGGALQQSLIRSYTYDTLLGLDYLHSNSLVHCDIKCNNLLVCEEGVKIADFGCAKIVEKNSEVTSFCFSGTPVFMAPEVARGEEQGFPADVWAVGCSVIEMATGCNPWPEMSDPMAALYRIGYSGEVPEVPKWLPEDCKDFLDKCLKFDAKERWTVEQLLEHPFVCGLNSGYETRSSPTSTLDCGFWESLPVPEVLPEVSGVVGFSGEDPVERMRQLVEGGGSSLPDWDDDEDEWIAVRKYGIEEMNVDCL